MIVEHYLREGQFDCAQIWESQMREIDENKLFYECHKITDKIKKGHLDDAIAWCES
jgi:hypothetical protein